MHLFQPFVDLLVGCNLSVVVVLGRFSFFQFNEIIAVPVFDAPNSSSRMSPDAFENFAFAAERFRCKEKFNIVFGNSDTFCTYPSLALTNP